MKIRRFFDTQGIISFPNDNKDLDALYSCFLSTRLGSLFQAIPWKQVVKELDLVDHKKGPQSTFSPRGKVVATTLNVSQALCGMFRFQAHRAFKCQFSVSNFL